MKRISAFAAALLAAAGLAACTAPEQATETNMSRSVVNADATVRETVLYANPQGAIDEIYENLDNEPRLTELDDEMLEALFGIDPAQVVDYVGYVSDAKSGLSDIVMIQPVDEEAEAAVRQGLLNYQTALIEQYRNYDILSSLSIAQNAVVYSQGDYVVFLMTSDNELGQDIVDRHMPL